MILLSLGLPKWDCICLVVVIYSHWHFRQIKVTWKTRLLNIQCAVISLPDIRRNDVWLLSITTQSSTCWWPSNAEPCLLMCYSHKDTRSPQVSYSRQPTRRTDTGASYSGTGAVHKSSIKKQPPQKGWFPAKTFDFSTERFCLQIGSKSG